MRKLWRKRYKDKVPIVHLWVESTKELDEFALWERDQSTISQIGDEFDSFIDGNPVLLGEREISLSWWLEEVQRHTYPSLSPFAIDILSIPAMLTGQNVFSRVPACYNVTVKEGGCLKSWIRSGVVAVVAGVRQTEFEGASYPSKT